MTLDERQFTSFAVSQAKQPSAYIRYHLQSPLRRTPVAVSITTHAASTLMLSAPGER